MVVTKTDAFARWFAKLRDPIAHASILVRLIRLEEGHLGDWKSVGKGVLELRVDVGAGYRIYFMRVGEDALVLLGGTKGTQAGDIAKARVAAAFFQPVEAKPVVGAPAAKTKVPRGRDP